MRCRVPPPWRCASSRTSDHGPARGVQRHLRSLLGVCREALRGASPSTRSNNLAGKHVVGTGMTAVDVGAALGLFSLDLWRLVGPSGRVIAIEPAESNTKLLAVMPEPITRPSKSYRPQHRTRTVSGSSSLPPSSDSHALYHHPLIDPSRAVQVRTVRLDSIVENADFIKIDVEGAEVEVLEGAGRLLKDRPPLVVEWVPSCQLAAGNQVADLPALLDAWATTCRCLTRSPMQ